MDNLHEVLHEVTVTIKVDPDKVTEGDALGLIEEEPLYGYLEDKLKPVLEGVLKETAANQGLDPTAFSVEVEN